MISLHSSLRRKLLTYFYLNQSARVYVRQLASLLGVDSTNLSRELARMQQEGLLRAEVEGRQRYYSLDPGYPHLKAVLSMLQGRVGIEPTVAASFRRVAGIEHAYLYGSFAKDEADASSDIDLLIIGRPDAATLAEAASGLERTLHREVNYLVLTPRELKGKLARKDPFLADVWHGKRIEIPLSEQDQTSGHQPGTGKAVSRGR